MVTVGRPSIGPGSVNGVEIQRIGTEPVVDKKGYRKNDVYVKGPNLSGQRKFAQY